MNGIRYFMRNFTATAVKEHLRSQLEDAPKPQLTPKGIELLRFVHERSADWDGLLTTPSGATSGRG